MKKINTKYLASAVALSGVMIAATSSSVFAETVPVYLTAEATPIDVEIEPNIDPSNIVDPTPENPQSGDEEIVVDPTPENPDSGDEIHIPATHGANAIYMYAKQDSNNAYVTGLKVKNNATSSPIYVTGIQLSNVTSGYTNAAFNEDFSAKAINSKNFGIAITKKGDTTLSTPADLKTGYTGTDTIAAEGTFSYSMAGKVSATSAAINEVKVADCVLTISQTNN